MYIIEVLNPHHYLSYWRNKPTKELQGTGKYVKNTYGWQTDDISEAHSYVTKDGAERAVVSLTKHGANISWDGTIPEDAPPRYKAIEVTVERTVPTNIHQQVIVKVKNLVINQARYIYPSADVDDMLNDAMYVVADDMTDEQTAKYLEGKDIISDDKLIALVEKMGVEDLYHDDHWIDNVANYIIENKGDCEDLWNHLKDNI